MHSYPGNSSAEGNITNVGFRFPLRSWSHFLKDFEPENTAAHMTLDGNNVEADDLRMDFIRNRSH